MRKRKFCDLSRCCGMALDRRFPLNRALSHSAEAGLRLLCGFPEVGIPRTRVLFRNPFVSTRATATENTRSTLTGCGLYLLYRARSLIAFASFGRIASQRLLQ